MARDCRFLSMGTPSGGATTCTSLAHSMLILHADVNAGLDAQLTPEYLWARKRRIVTSKNDAGCHRRAVTITTR